MIEPHVGMAFTHATRTTPDGEPLTCTVTRIAERTIHYKASDGQCLYTDRSALGAFLGAVLG